MWLSLSLFLASATSLAEQPERPLRPTTHPGDPALSEGPVVNFQRLYVDPDTIASQLTPSKIEKSKKKESLAIINKTTGWTDLTVSGVKIGRIPPLTTAIIHEVKPGDYNVEQVVENTQYTLKEVVSTTTIEGIITPGNAKAAIAATPEYQKPIFDTQEPPVGGQMATYIFPVAPAPEPTLEEGVEGEEGEEEVLTSEEPTPSPEE